MQPSNLRELQHLQQRVSYTARPLALPEKQPAHHGIMQVVHALWTISLNDIKGTLALSG